MRKNKIKIDFQRSNMRQSLNTLRLRQNGRHFPDDIFKCIFFNENVWIFIKISLRLFLRVQLTIFHHWFIKWLGVGQATSHCLTTVPAVYHTVIDQTKLSQMAAEISRDIMELSMLTSLTTLLSVCSWSPKIQIRHPKVPQNHPLNRSLFSCCLVPTTSSKKEEIKC